MSILTTIWSMISGACLMLCFLHLLLWWKDRHQRVYLLSALMALASGAGALIELGLMRSESIAAHATLLRAQNIAVAVILVAMVWFVQGYLRTGRRWLAAVISASWAFCIVVNLLSPNSLVFAEIHEVVPRETFWGETFHTARGATHPLKIVADLTSFLIAVYVAEATFRAWRCGRRQAALVVGASITVFIVIAGIHAPLVDAGRVATPFMVSVAFLTIVSALSYQLADDASRALRYGREIRAGERRWRTLLNEVQLVVVDLDPAGRVRYVNPFFERLSGRRALEVVGQPFTALMIAEESGDLAARFAAAASEGPRPRSRWTVAAADGRGRVCDWSSVRLVTPEGDFDGILSVGADVTEALQARRDLERTRRRLDRVIRANMLGELVSAFSHELNQPLAAILSNAQAARRYLAQGRPRVDDVRGILDQIVADDKRAAAVIERLRALMERGEILREDLALVPLLDEVVALVQPELHQQGIRLELLVPADTPPVQAGRVEVQQVLLNLLVNAVRALEGVPESTRRITIAASNGDERVTLTVADTGPGIPADQIDRLFEPFHGDRDGQLGMGLAICRRILEAYGGSIQAESGDGGASFRFTLPVAAVGKQVSRG